MSTSEERVIKVDESMFDESKDIDWMDSEEYILFINKLDRDFRNDCDLEQRANRSYFSVFTSATESYPLFRIYLKTASQIGKDDNNFYFKFRLKVPHHYLFPDEVFCMVDVHYSSGFVQNIMLESTESNDGDTKLQTTTSPKHKTTKQHSNSNHMNHSNHSKHSKHSNNSNHFNHFNHFKDTNPSKLSNPYQSPPRSMSSQQQYPFSVYHNPTASDPLRTTVQWPCHLQPHQVELCCLRMLKYMIFHGDSARI